MIGQKAIALTGLPSCQTKQHVHCVHLRHSEHCGRPVVAPTHAASPSLVQSHCRKRSLQQTKAVDRDIGGYTPSDYISWSEDPKQQCHHRAEVVVDAPVDVCFSLWMDWAKLIDFLDLVGQIGLDDDNPEMALFQCFYRYRKLPLMEITFLLERTHVEPNKRIKFQTCYGMPMSGQVDLQEQADGQTRVRLSFTHGVPNLLVQLQVGPFGVETDLMQILKENLAEYKTLAEQQAPADWQQQKEQVAARAQQQKQLRVAKQQAQQQQVEPVADSDTQEQPQQPMPPLAAAPAAAAAKQTPQPSSAAEAAATRKPRGRPSTSRRTASKAAAAELSGSSPAGRSRSSTSVAGNGAGDQQSTRGRPGRRSSRRTTVVKEQ